MPRTVQRCAKERPVKFEITEQTRQAVDDYLKTALKAPNEFLFAGRRGKHRCLTTRQYARLLSEWFSGIGLDPSLFGTHSIRRTKATLIYQRTGNMRAVQLLLGHTKARVLLDTWVSRSMMPWTSLKRSMFRKGRRSGYAPPFSIL